jgi:hypothetical protein
MAKHDFRDDHNGLHDSAIHDIKVRAVLDSCNVWDVHDGSND